VTRTARRKRATSETKVVVELDLDGGEVAVASGIPFFDHMLEQLGRHGGLGLRISAAGDLEVDAHHTVEDTGLVLGEALTEAVGDKKGIRRYGHALVPMDDALARVALDLSGRAHLSYRVRIPAEMIGSFDISLTEEFLHALCRGAGLTLHVALLDGRNAHHAVEAIFKALARALSNAVSLDSRAAGGIPSTKGVL
jgi:imidazoleglycerol-phosphate dehydratase